ncbi:DUF2855 family protein [Sessilibacter sp. MAH4]
MLGIPVLDFQIDRSDWSRYELQESTLDMDALAPGQVLLRVDRFGLSANNITYAVLGDALRYWQFFPAPEGWGILPVWGFAEVQASRCPGVEPGERWYGYYPMSSHLLVEPTQLKAGSFIDATTHRQSLPLLYNQYLRTSKDVLYTVESEAAQILLRPLFTTAFVLDDFLASNGFFGAGRLLMTSASSKTAIATATLLKSQRGKRGLDYEVVGLTSPGHRAFVEGLGCYDHVLAYSQLVDLDSATPTLVVDFSGNSELLERLHRTLGPQLQYSCLVGAAHWDQRGGLPSDLPGPAPKLFFAPAQAEKRLKEWGGERFQSSMIEHWSDFLSGVGHWLSFEEGHGHEAVGRVYAAMLKGQANPQLGYILSLSNSQSPAP